MLLQQIIIYQTWISRLRKYSFTWNQTAVLTWTKVRYSALKSSMIPTVKYDHEAVWADADLRVPLSDWKMFRPSGCKSTKSSQMWLKSFLDKKWGILENLVSAAQKGIYFRQLRNIQPRWDSPNSQPFILLYFSVLCVWKFIFSLSLQTLCLRSDRHVWD